jgi:hypothetical protein
MDIIKELGQYKASNELDIRYLHDKGFIRCPIQEGKLIPVFCEITAKGVDEIENNWVRRNFQTVIILLNFTLSIIAICISYVTLTKP